MSGIATAIVGGAVVGAYATSRAGDAAADATREGSANAANAQIYSTDRQIQEIQRQFNYQVETLQPRLEAQGAGTDAFRALTGTIGNELERDPITGRPMEIYGRNQQERRAEERLDFLRNQEQEIGRAYIEATEQITALQAERDAAIAAERDAAIANAPPRNRRIGGVVQDVASGLIDSDWEPTADPSFDLQMQNLRARAENSLRQLTDIDEQIQAADRNLESTYGAREFLEGGSYRQGEGGSFFDPLLNRQRLAETETLSGQVQNTLQAGTTPENDPFRNYIADNQIAAATPEEDARFMRARDVTNAGDSLQTDVLRTDIAGRQLADGAAGTNVYGEDFETSPGYNFMVEEMDRALDRRNSAGGNYGGRAIMEAQRRAQGLAAGEYYNWAAGRTQDLQRLAGAEATDAARLDNSATNYLARRAEDIRRGDTALSQYEDQRVMDQGRGDAAFENYLARRQGDATRMDQAAANVDRLQGVDLQRQDQSYYNFLNNQALMSGFGDPSAQAVDASNSAGSQVANAYGSQGASLAGIYQRQGENMANINSGTIAGINNAAQSGISNFLMYQALG